jgi:hypothetical protein
MRILQLLAEALLYYAACSLIARTREEAPGFLRVLFVVVLLTFISGGVKAVIGDFWLSSAIVFVVNFVILWIGLGVGFFRTVIAAILVAVLRWLLTAVFSGQANGLL